jgi:hypothetical protein
VAKTSYVGDLGVLFKGFVEIGWYNGTAHFTKCKQLFQFQKLPLT